MIVTVNKLNRRSSPIANVADKSNIIDTVSKGFSFDSIEQTTNAAGTWYKDALNNYYWAGGLIADGSNSSNRALATATAYCIPVSSTLLKPPQIIPHDMPLSKSACIICSSWMKDNFEDKIIAAVSNTPFDEDLVYAIACQETAQRWQMWINVADAATILARCVFDASGDFPDTTRGAFPKNKNEFIPEYGNILTQMLVDEGNKMRAMPQPRFSAWIWSSSFFI